MCERFRETINELADLSDEDLQMKVSIDMQLPFPYITEGLIHELELLEPFGKGNPRAAVCGEKSAGNPPGDFRKKQKCFKMPA